MSEPSSLGVDVSTVHSLPFSRREEFGYLALGSLLVEKRRLLVPSPLDLLIESLRPEKLMVEECLMVLCCSRLVKCFY